MILMKNTCAAIAGVARSHMPIRHDGAARGVAAPSVRFEFDRHGDLVPVDDLEQLSTMQRKPARAATVARMATMLEFKR